jgi:hypothetical protein
MSFNLTNVELTKGVKITALPWILFFQSAVSTNNLPVFADNASALAGGLKKNDPYVTSAGALMIVMG